MSGRFPQATPGLVLDPGSHHCRESGVRPEGRGEKSGPETLDLTPLKNHDPPHGVLIVLPMYPSDKSPSDVRGTPLPVPVYHMSVDHSPNPFSCVPSPLGVRVPVAPPLGPSRPALRPLPGLTRRPPSDPWRKISSEFLCAHRSLRTLLSVPSSCPGPTEPRRKWEVSAGRRWVTRSLSLMLL